MLKGIRNLIQWRVHLPEFKFSLIKSSQFLRADKEVTSVYAETDVHLVGAWNSRSN